MVRLPINITITDESTKITELRWNHDEPTHENYSDGLVTLEGRGSNFEREADNITEMQSSNMFQGLGSNKTVTLLIL